jgi:hypothetical protein
MNRISIRRAGGVLAALAALLAAAIVAAPAALARATPPRGPWAHPRHPIPFPPHAHAAAGGMAYWQAVLILVGGAVLVAAVALLIGKVRAARRLPVTAA